MIQLIAFACALMCAYAQVTPDTITTTSKCGLFPGSSTVLQPENLQSFPGFGWDNLRNLPMAAVFDMYSYKQCRLSPAREHIVPDYVDVIPVKKSTVDRFAEYYKDFRDYYEATGQSINFEAGASYKGFGISGSYSNEYQQTKRNTLTTSTSIMKTAITVHAYSLVAEPNAPLSDDFLSRIKEIGDALRQNKTNLAEYMCQVLVRDFGTHVVTRVEAGSYVKQEDYVDKELVLTSLSSLEEARAAAAVNFFNVVNMKFSAGRSVNSSQVDKYQKITKHSTLNSVGGPSIMNIADANDWFNSSIEDLVALDRSGDPIYWYITEIQIADMPTPMIMTIQELVKSAVEVYYAENTITGCTDPTAPNFKYIANLDDGSCAQPYSNYSFGGVYQKCEVVSGSNAACDGLQVMNGEDGVYSCPDDYEPELLIVGNSSSKPYPIQQCEDQAYRCWQHLWIFGKCHRTVCHNEFVTDTVQYSAYWCKASVQVPAKTGYLYAGAYSQSRLNPFTNGQSCPGQFFAVTLGAGTDTFAICLSRDYELDTQYSISFGGFLSCQNGAMTRCPTGYSQHLLNRINNCELYYCIRTGAMTLPGISKVRRPPFITVSPDSTALFALYSYPDGRLWAWNETMSVWEMEQDTVMTGKEALQQYVGYLNATT